MSRIGQLPIQLLSGVTLSQTNGTATVTGPKGELSQLVNPMITIEVSGTTIQVSRNLNSRPAKALHGLTRQLLANMITGVSTGFTKNLEMKGTGYRAEVQGNDLILSVGFSHQVRITAPAGISFKVEKNTNITVEGIDRQLVGKLASEIRLVRKPEPYKGKGIRYAGEVIRLKPGKTAKAGA